MKNSELEKEIVKINARIDRLCEVIEKQNYSKTCVTVNSPKSDELMCKIYTIVNRMKFDNDIQMWDRRAADVDDKIKDLELQKQHIMYEKQEIERRYYGEG